MNTPKLGQLITRRLLLGATLALVILNIVIGFVSHQQLHDRMDSMLLELAVMEAKLSSAEKGPVHIHNSPMYLPGWSETTVRKGVVYDEHCKIVASSWVFKDTSEDTMPSEWCTREQISTHHVGFITLDGLELRAASTTMIHSKPGTQLSFLVGVDHRIIDGAVFRLILLGIFPSLFLLLVLWGLSRQIISTVTRDLEHISLSCENLHPEVISELDEEILSHKLAVSEHAPQEIKILSSTLSALVLRLQRTLQTQSRFIAEAAHELRSPLTAMRGEIEVTLRRERENSEYKESLEMLLGDVLKMQQLGEHLLTTAKAQEHLISLQSIDLIDVLKNCVTSLGAQFKEVGLTVELPTQSTLMVKADALYTQRVCINLLHNVLMHANASKVKLWIKEYADARVELFIEDNGQGIPEDLLPHVFAPFQRKSQHSYGLGLHMARRLMEAQRGALNLHQHKDGVTWRLEFIQPNLSS